MRIRLTVAMVAITLLSFASFAEAQPGPRPGGPGGLPGPRTGGPSAFGGNIGGGLSRLALCRIPAVQEELELTEAQIEKIQKLMEEMRPQFNRPGGDPGDERREGRRRGAGDRNRRDRSEQPSEDEGAAQFQPGEYFVQEEDQPRPPQFSEEQREEFQRRMEEFRKQAEERAKEIDAKLNEILLPHQATRLNEIRIQLMGIGALNDPEVAKELKITDKQKEEIATARQEASETMRSELRALFEAGDREAIREKIEEFRKEADEKVLNCLTKDQQQQFEKMKGKPFELPQGAFGFPGGNRGPRPGGDRPDGERGPQSGNRPQQPDA